MRATTQTLLGAKGPLAKRLPGFSHRAEQLALAETIDAALFSGRPALAEAGTGVGKTLGYLVPLLQFLAPGNRRAVISTHTLALQSQLIERDIPALLDVLPEVEIDAAVLKGRGNFLCLQELDIARGELWTAGDPTFAMVSRWANETETGDQAELDFTFSGWSEIAAHQDTCRQRECRHYDRCFYYKGRKTAEAAQLLVVNHALFFADLRLRKQNPNGPSLIPNYDAVVFDEAHHVDDTATRAFGLEWSGRRVPYLLARCRRVPNLSESLLNTIDALHARLMAPLEAAGPAERFLAEGLPDTRDQQAFTGLRDSLSEQLDLLARELVRRADLEKPGPEKDRASGLAKMTTRTATELTIAASMEPDPDAFGWYQTRKTRTGQVSTTLVRTPHTVADFLADTLYERCPRVAFVSATLSSVGGFAPLRERLGLVGEFEPIETIQGSPFNYKKNCLLYIPRHLGPPSPTDAFADSTLAEIENLIAASRGRAFVLFTSHRMLARAKERLQQNRMPYPLLCQGDAPNGRLVESFVAAGNAVLLGTSSFWEGVDVPGDALSLVILDKLPFATPDSPTQRAREARIKDVGGDAFKEYSLPLAGLRLKQGFGRLLRRASDRGVVAILDERLLSKYYGRILMENLPKCPRTEDLDDVREFLSEG